MASPGLPYPERFHSAALYVKQQPNLPGTKQLSQEAQLLLYALSQQAVLGSNNHPKPWAWNVVESAKWQAWKQLGSMSTVESMRLYVRTLEEEQSDWYPILLKAPRSSSHSQIGESAGSPMMSGLSALEMPCREHDQPAQPKSAPLSMAVRVVDVVTHEVELVSITGPSPSARGGHTATLIGDQLYIFGGEDPFRRALPDLWVLDLTSMTWNQPATIGRAPSARSAATAAAFLDRYLLLFGGGSVASCFADLWLLDTATLAWATPRVGGAAVGSRAGHAGAVLGSQWVIVGGGNNVKGESSARRGGVMPLSAGRGV
ncbi:MAG: hypothetical protein WDW38_010721 [Sanguina aurantia]